MQGILSHTLDKTMVSKLFSRALFPFLGFLPALFTGCNQKWEKCPNFVKNVKIQFKTEKKEKQIVLEKIKQNGKIVSVEGVAVEKATVEDVEMVKLNLKKLKRFLKSQREILEKKKADKNLLKNLREFGKKVDRLFEKLKINGKASALNLSRICWALAGSEEIEKNEKFAKYFQLPEIGGGLAEKVSGFLSEIFSRAGVSSQTSQSNGQTRTEGETESQERGQGQPGLPSLEVPLGPQTTSLQHQPVVSPPHPPAVAREDEQPSDETAIEEAAAAERAAAEKAAADKAAAGKALADPTSVDLAAVKKPVSNKDAAEKAFNAAQAAAMKAEADANEAAAAAVPAAANPADANDAAEKEAAANEARVAALAAQTAAEKAAAGKALADPTFVELAAVKKAVSNKDAAEKAFDAAQAAAMKAEAAANEARVAALAARAAANPADANDAAEKKAAANEARVAALAARAAVKKAAVKKAAAEKDVAAAREAYELTAIEQYSGWEDYWR